MLPCIALITNTSSTQNALHTEMLKCEARNCSSKASTSCRWLVMCARLCVSETFSLIKVMLFYLSVGHNKHEIFIFIHIRPKHCVFCLSTYHAPFPKVDHPVKTCWLFFRCWTKCGSQNTSSTGRFNFLRYATLITTAMQFSRHACPD